LVEALNPWVAKNYANLNETKAASISYKSSTEGLTTNVEKNEQILTERLAEVSYQEIERGVTLIGPHRDDLHLQLGEFPAKGYASHGESWSIAIALRIGSFNLLKSEGAEPILILDDIFAELDTSRRQQLTSVAQMAEQTIITAAVESDLPSELLTEKYYVTPGAVKKASS
jgi:DNA replication and repair protein RecF